MENEEKQKITIASFGYKYGSIAEASLLFDVRFLPNPHYTPQLRALSGMDMPVRDFMRSHEATVQFFERMKELVLYYIKETSAPGRDIIIAFGCTGGRHRSVYFAQSLYETLCGMGFGADIFHRDMEKKQ